MKILQSLGLFKSSAQNHLFYYPSPANLTYNWNFGSLAGIALGIQILSGLLLTSFYSPSAFNAFDSLEHFVRDVNWGWLIHYIHSNGASFFFFVLYWHIGRGLYYRSYAGSLNFAWLSGVLLFILVMATAFLGYVLPWGQMSFWGATVITNLFSVFPIVGTDLVLWLWGGFSVDTPTIGRFFMLHFILPFFIAVVAILHILFVHQAGSSNPLRGLNRTDMQFFVSYFGVKDLFGTLLYFFLFSITIIYFPNLFGHPDNYIPANPLVTPPHIVPEWYFLPFYAILRSIPNKLVGVLLMFGSLLTLLFLPLLYSISLTRISTFKGSIQLIYYPLLSPQFNFIHRVFYWIFVSCFVLLGWLGGQPATEPYVTISLILTIFYFFYFTFWQLVLNTWFTLFITKKY